MQSFHIGQTISRASTLIGTTLGSVGLFSVIFQSISGVISYVLRGRMVAAMGGAEAMADPATRAGIFLSGWYWVMLATSMALGAVLMGGAITAMLKADRGEPVTLGDCVAAGLAKALPVFGLTILWILGISVGFGLLAVPGCILIAMWSVAMPALIAEDTSVFGAFGRSRALTKGARWKIFLLLLIVVIALYVPVMVVSALFSVQSSGGFAASIYTSGPLQVVTGAFGVIVGLVINAVLVSIYGELIEMKGEQASSVFD